MGKDTGVKFSVMVRTLETARDKESHEPISPDRYSIRKTSDRGQYFRITKQGNIYNEKELDRETHAWYNLTVEANELDSRGEWPHFPSYLGPFFSFILSKPT